MSNQKKGFGAFIRPQPAPGGDAPATESEGRGGEPARARGPVGVASGGPSRAAQPAEQPDGGRIRQVTSTGRVRTYSANRQLPGITLRLSEERWERLKMMSIQERRPLQDILGEAMERYMRERGLPW